MAGSRRVLIVEDEVLIRMLAVDMLEELGFATDEAGNAAEALQKLKPSGGDYVLIFLDIGLPDKKGDDLLKEIRAFNAAIPVLVASGEAKADLKKRLDGFAPIGYLTKPYDQDRLSAALAALKVA
ncbi:MAG: response regulator [Pseudorhodoplanes sp.]|nr:response regulator [Pseudorhodoplanes sp.]